VDATSAEKPFGLDPYPTYECLSRHGSNTKQLIYRTMTGIK
jgi:hypothetical protein